MTRQFSAGGVVFKKEGDRLLWLLVQPKGGDEFHNQIRWGVKSRLKSGTTPLPRDPAKFHLRDFTRWQLPKGWLNEGEKSEEAAIREVEEEGGVKAEIISKIDTIKIFFRNTFEGKPKETVLKTITYFLMKYKEDVEQGFGWETQEISWLPFEEAQEKLTFKSEKEILEKAQKILETSTPQKSLF